VFAVVRVGWCTTGVSETRESPFYIALQTMLAHPTLFKKQAAITIPTTRRNPYVKLCGLVLRNDPQKVTRTPIARIADAVCYTAKWLESSTRHSVE
jgi:hypothetical protein